MNTFQNLLVKLNLAQFGKDESGAAMVEYTILTGMITVAVIVAVIAVGGWVNGQWTALRTALGV
jgi:pilus assembly protein Flp/PilA